MTTTSSLRPASLKARFVAGAIDGALFFVPATVLFLPVMYFLRGFEEGVSSSRLATAFLVYTVWLGAVGVISVTLGSMKGGSRGTPGMRVASTRLVDERTLRPVGLMMSLLRYVLLYLTILSIVGLVLMVLDRDRRGWHDKVVGSVTIEVTAPGAGGSLPVEAVSDADGEASPDSADADEKAEDDGPASVVDEDGEKGEGRSRHPKVKAAKPGEIIASVPGFTPPKASPAARRQEVISSLPDEETLKTLAPATVRGEERGEESSSVAVEPPVSASAPSLEDEEEDTEATRLSSAQSSSGGTLLVWDDGVVTIVTRVAVFGRNPVAGDLGDADLVQVEDLTRSLSKTHFALVVDEDQLFVIDRHSTNGTEIVSPDGSTRGAFPGIRTPVVPGDRIVIAQRNLTIGRA